MTKHGNAVYLHHIVDSINKINGYIDNCGFEKFTKNTMMLDAVLRNFEIIGEASNNLSEDFKESYSHIDFHSATDIRNRLIHGYDDVNLEIVWNTVKKDLPEMKKAIEKILNN